MKGIGKAIGLEAAVIAALAGCSGETLPLRDVEVPSTRTTVQEVGYCDPALPSNSGSTLAVYPVLDGNNRRLAGMVVNSGNNGSPYVESRVNNLPSIVYDNQSPDVALSPDGETLVYTDQGVRGYNAGTAQRNPTENLHTRLLVYDPSARDVSVCPGGERVFYGTKDSEGKLSINSARIGGGDIKSETGGLNYDSFDPQVSNDGKSLAYSVRETPRSFTQVEVRNSDGAYARTAGPSSKTGAIWLNDHEVLYTDSQHGLMRWNPGTGDTEQIDPMIRENATLTATGDRIMYRSNMDGNPNATAVVVKALDGSRPSSFNPGYTRMLGGDIATGRSQ